MKNVTRVFSVSAIVMALASGAAQASPETHASVAAQAFADPTRQQVRAELIAAEKSGDISFGQEGKTLREMWPQRYAQAQKSDAGAAANQAAGAASAPVQGAAESSIDNSTLRD
jgi:hypothetical protein